MTYSIQHNAHLVTEKNPHGVRHHDTASLPSECEDTFGQRQLSRDIFLPFLLTGAKIRIFLEWGFACLFDDVTANVRRNM
ncbi:hypothetical protein CEXT_185211 [Caerostris extrusa]|uniref:Uncharacterized protein n=1 Tax=Caerostris extrusa TaxID=172846 RepID=A0AAV4W623_CAEEX|nr:hypothetical protein CEXT_185211 [Caerostris extrusa]